MDAELPQKPLPQRFVTFWTVWQLYGNYDLQRLTSFDNQNKLTANSIFLRTLKKKKGHWQLLNIAATCGSDIVGTNENLTKKLKEKSGNEIYIEFFFKDSDVFLGIKKSTCMCRTVGRLRKAWKSLNFSPPVDLEPLHKQEVKAIEE